VAEQPRLEVVASLRRNSSQTRIKGVEPAMEVAYVVLVREEAESPEVFMPGGADRSHIFLSWKSLPKSALLDTIDCTLSSC
jgi:hypothetical protein